MPTPIVLTAPSLPPLLDARLVEAAANGAFRLEQLTGGAAPEDILQDVAVLAVSGGSRVEADLIDSLPKLKLIAVHGVGYDGVDVDHARSRGVVVSNTPDVLNADVADLAVLLALSVLRRLPQADRHVRDGDWASGQAFPLTRSASGLNYGLLGMGRIGQEIARRLAPFAGDIAYHSRRPAPGVDHRHEPDLIALADWADVLIVIVPGSPATRGLVNARVLDALGPRGVLINVARGEVVDQTALIEALTTGRLGGAGLDVFVGEPDVPAALIACETCALTPHVGSATVESREAMARLVMDNICAVLAGEPAVTPV